MDSKMLLKNYLKMLQIAQYKFIKESWKRNCLYQANFIILLT